MNPCKPQSLMTIIFVLAMGLVGYGYGNREDIVYIGQFSVLLIGVLMARHNRALVSSMLLLLLADIAYYILVYKLNYGTENKYVVLLSSVLYTFSFCSFVAFLLRKNWQRFLRIASERSQVSIILFFAFVAGYYILIPGLEKLFSHGPSFGHLSNFLTLISSLPLAVVCYIFLTNGQPKIPQTTIIGFFVLSTLDIGIQLETIKYGDLKFSLYDILWFFGVYLISISANEFSKEEVYLLSKKSIDNLIKKIFFISALVPMLAVYFVTTDILNLSPMYFIFVVISIFLFGIGVSKIIYRYLENNNQTIREILSNESKVTLNTVLNNSPVEFHESLVSVYNKIIEKDVNELAGQKNKVAEQQQIYKKMAHDLASPLSVLEILSRLPGTIEKDQKRLLIQATQRVRHIADDILLKGRSTTFKNRRVFQTLSTANLKPLIKNLILEKNFEIGNRKNPIQIEFDPLLLQTEKKIVAVEEEFARLLSNLLNNSIEAIGNNIGTITIMLMDRNDHLEIQMQDDGPGFPMDILTLGLSKPISISKANGQGIGLYSAATTLRNWHGSMSIQNHEGARITLKLPYCPEDAFLRARETDSSLVEMKI